MVTVVTVAYNAGESIARTIRSVLHQSYTDYEYIIVDGGSDDDTLQIIKRFSTAFEKKRISFRFVTEKDEGIYDAMNKGIRMASEQSDWINFLNADDHYRDRDVLSDLFSEKYEPSVTAVYGDTIIRRENGQKYRKKASEIDTIRYKVPFVHQALFVRTGVIREYPFDCRWKLAADYEQWLKIYLAGGVFKRIKRDVAVFDSAGTSGKRFMEYIQEMLEIQKQNDLMKKYKIRRFVRNRLIPCIKENKAVYYFYAKIKSR